MRGSDLTPLSSAPLQKGALEMNWQGSHYVRTVVLGVTAALAMSVVALAYGAPPAAAQEQTADDVVAWGENLPDQLYDRGFYAEGHRQKAPDLAVYLHGNTPAWGLRPDLLRRKGLRIAI